MSRATPFMGPELAAMLADFGDDVIILGGADYSSRPERPPPLVLAPPEPATPTAADLERLRLAALRRARKTAQQARGFALPKDDTDQ